MKLQYNLDDIKTFAIPAGRHRAKVVGIKQTLSKKKKPMLEWTWKIVSGPAKGQTVRSWTSLVENALSNLKDHLTAFGFNGKVTTSTERLVGRYAVLVIGPTISTDSEGNEREFSNVLSVKPDGEMTSPAPDSKKKSKPIEDDEDDDEDDVEEIDDEDDEDEDDVEDADDEEDDEDDEEDEAPVKKSPFKKHLKAFSKPAKKVLKKSRHQMAADDDEIDDDDIPF